MSFTDIAMLTARKAGAYEAIAEMMCESIRDLDDESDWKREWALARLHSLAKQFEETVEDYKKEVDTA
jgi:hypothetical protein